MAATEPVKKEEPWPGGPGLPDDPDRGNKLDPQPVRAVHQIDPVGPKDPPCPPPEEVAMDYLPTAIYCRFFPEICLYYLWMRGGGI